jgi:GNAT superfamily N-acetyltransferase
MNAIQNFKQTGWKFSIAILFNRIVPQRLFRMRRFVVYRIAIAAACTDPSIDLNTSSEAAIVDSIAPSADSSLSVSRCVDEAEIGLIEQMTYFQRSYTTGNSIAYAAKLDDRLAAGMWAATSCFNEQELGVKISLDENQTWLFAALVSKHFRRRGIYSKLLRFTVADMAKQGYVEQLVAVNPDNLASNQIHKSLSQETVGQVLAIRFWRTTCCWTWGGIRKDSTISWNSTKSPIGIQFESL